MTRGMLAAAAAASIGWAASAGADENLFGYVRGAEPLPKGAWEVYNWTTLRSDKDIGHYRAYDTETEVEYGFTDRFTGTLGFNTLSIDTSRIRIDGYVPADEDYTLHLSGMELYGKYNFLSAAEHPLGLSMRFGLDYSRRDPHSGQDKTTASGDVDLILQAYGLEGQVVWVGNFGLESTYADRDEISNLPPAFEWPTDPEMELELKFGTGMSYRFLPNWFIGVEAVYETEFETEVGQERWTWFAGPSLHYGGERWWATFTWFPQLRGGGEQAEGQDHDLHLIEKTRQEFRFKVGLNF